MLMQVVHKYCAVYIQYVYVLVLVCCNNQLTLFFYKYTNPSEQAETMYCS